MAQPTRATVTQLMHYTPPDHLRVHPSVFNCTKLTPWDPSRHPPDKSIVHHDSGVLQSGTTFKCGNCGTIADVSKG